jgi:radical SAM protein with 4Fe4S-binding SPASM domain
MERHVRPFKLREFKIEVTYRCDLNCVHCSSDARPSNGLEMSRTDSLRILNEAKALGASEVAFSGGEPLGWPHLEEAVSRAVQLGFRTTIYTSGNTEGFKPKARRMQRLGADRFVFSIFGGVAATHERVTRVRGSFAVTAEAIAVAGRTGLRTELHFVPMSTNYRELREVAGVASKCGVAEISVLRLVSQGRAALLSGRALDRVQNLELRTTIRELRDAGLKIRLGSPYNILMLNEKPGCWAAIDRLIVAPDLKVYPCDAFKRINATDLVGSDRWSDLHYCSLTECWSKSPYLEAVRTYLTTDFGEPCDSCGFLEKCLSGCLAQKTLAEGALKKCADPDCLGPSLVGEST